MPIQTSTPTAQRPTVGRVVHYYETAGKHDKVPHFGPYAAIVCATRAEDDRLKSDMTAMVKVLVPPEVSGKTGSDYYTRAEFSTEPAAGCWSWPPRV